jgi:hypothetical protein
MAVAITNIGQPTTYLEVSMTSDSRPTTMAEWSDALTQVAVHMAAQEHRSFARRIRLYKHIRKSMPWSSGCDIFCRRQRNNTIYVNWKSFLVTDPEVLIHRILAVSDEAMRQQMAVGIGRNITH